MPDLHYILTAIGALDEKITNALTAIEALDGNITNVMDTTQVGFRILAAQMATVRNAQAEAYRRYLESIYEFGNPQSIDANLSADAHNWVDAHYDEPVLSSALMAFVYSWAQAKANEIRGQISLSVELENAIFALSIPGLEFFAVPIVGLALTTGHVPALDLSERVAALTDKTALDQVVCAMAAKMGPEAISASSLAFALTESSFDTDSHQQRIKDVIESSLSQNYLVFLGIFGIAYARYESDLEPVIVGPDCPEEPPPPDVWRVVGYGAIGEQTATSVTVNATPIELGYALDLERIDELPFLIASISTDLEPTGAYYSWYDADFNYIEEPVEVGDNVEYIYYSGTGPFSLTITVTV